MQILGRCIVLYKYHIKGKSASTPLAEFQNSNVPAIGYSCAQYYCVSDFFLLPDVARCERKTGEKLYLIMFVNLLSNQIGKYTLVF